MRIVAGKFRGRALAAPESANVRPTADRVREAVFNIVASRIGPNLTGLSVLDLFAGTGAMGIEALSRGAEGCVFVDSGVEARALLRENIQRFGVAGRARLLRRDATDLGAAGNLGPFHLVFADPPYRRNLGEAALASAVSGGWLADDALAVLEEARDAVFVPPEGFTVLDERNYGDTKVSFIGLSADRAEADADDPSAG